MKVVMLDQLWRKHIPFWRQIGIGAVEEPGVPSSGQKMEAVGSYKLNDIMSQKTVILTVTAVNTSNLTFGDVVCPENLHCFFILFFFSG